MKPAQTKRRRSRGDSSASLSDRSISRRSNSISQSNASTSSQDIHRPASPVGVAEYSVRSDTTNSTNYLRTDKMTHVEAEETKTGKKTFSTSLFLTPDSVGAEGAYKSTQSKYLRQRKQAGDKEKKASPTTLSFDDSISMQTSLPTLSVLEYISVKREEAQLCNELMWFVPFLILFTMFAIWGSGDSLNFHLNETTLRRRADIGLFDLWDKHTSIMTEAFKIDSERSGNNNTSPFVPGGSTRFGWMYSNYDENINGWTPQPNASAAVDRQISRISTIYRDPAYVNLWSIRTKRDLMRWFEDTFVTQHWNCGSETYGEPWMSSRRGSQRMVGAARVVTQRRMADNRCKRSELQGLVSCQASGTKSEPSMPPLTPESFCDKVNPALPTQTLFQYRPSLKGYEMLLPFTSSCSVVKSALSIIETEKQEVDWVDGKNYVMMSELWNEYRMDTDNVSSCESFLFHRSVSQLTIEYVVFAPVIDSFMYVTTNFQFEATGTTTKPSMLIYTTPVWSAHVHFTTLALSIVLAIYLIYYIFHFCVKHVEQYRMTVAGMRKTQQNTLIRGVVIVQQILQIWSLFLILAFVFTFADLIVLWWMWGQAGDNFLVKYDERFLFPQAIADYCKKTTLLRSRLLAAATFFVFLSTVRFCVLYREMWILLETVYNALGTILGIVIIWMLVAMGLCVCCILIFGEATAEFSTIASSYGTLILMYIDRGKWLFTDVGWNTGTTDFSTTVPSAVGTLLDQDQPFLHAYVRGKMFSTSVSLFQLVLYTFIFLFVFLVNSWTIAVLAESYERVSARRKSVLWGTTESFRRVYRGLRRSMSIEYLTESARRMLWARQTEQLYADMEKTIQDSLRQRNADLNSKLTYTSLLWLLPRELQAEMGPCHLRKLWLSCADYVETLTRHDTNALAQQWRQHWEKCEDGIQGWLLSVMPKEVELETKSVEVGILLDELPPKIVNYVERFGS